MLSVHFVAFTVSLFQTVLIYRVTLVQQRSIVTLSEDLLSSCVMEPTLWHYCYCIDVLCYRIKASNFFCPDESHNQSSESYLHIDLYELGALLLSS